MDRSVIPEILNEIHLNEKDVANIYQHGSWVYGTNTPKSDYDLIFVTRSPRQRPLEFHEEFPYFHKFMLYRLWDEYDVCVYSVENFEKLLEINFLVAVQCLFLPDQFKIKEQINFQSMYLENYYNPLRIKRVAAYEMSSDLQLYYSRDSASLPDHPSSRQIASVQQRKDYIFKNLAHGIRFLDFAKQLLETKSIQNFTSATPLFHQMQTIRGHHSSNLGLDRVAEFARKKSLEYKIIFESLVPGNLVKGIFEVHITFARTKHVVDQLRTTCENSRYKLLFDEWTTSQQREISQQLVVSSSYKGECPAIIKQIENEAYDYFKNFDIIRIKIELSESNEGIPLYDLEKQLLWNDETNYFTLNFIFRLDRDYQETIRGLRKICRSMFQNPSSVQLPRTALKHTRIEDDQFILTIDLFHVGRTNALRKRNEIRTYFLRRGFQLSEVRCNFIVYDTNVKLEQD